MMGALLGLVMMVGLVVSVSAIAIALEQRRELRGLRARLDRLEGIEAPAHEVVPDPSLPPAAPSPPASMEQQVGGVWLQNAGAVLLILGVFFLILWGYSNGTLGPGALVAAGVGLGFAFVWRGDRLTRTLPRFGHALIGVGLGIVYLALYLGHFTLGALGTRTGFALLALASLATVAVGRHYRAQTVAALGVLGAFVPLVLAVWLPQAGFRLAPALLLGYLGLVDAVVLALVVSARWGHLLLMGVLLTTFTWLCASGSGSWGWSVQAGLSALYALLALLPLPRLARVESRALPQEIAVVALTPLCYLAASFPFLARLPAAQAGAVVFGMSVVWFASALWIEARRENDDLWRPLTGAGVAYLTVSLWRVMGDFSTPAAWCAEGLGLVWIGLVRRNRWWRACGLVVSALGAVWLLALLVEDRGWSAGSLPLLHPAGLRNLACLLALLGTSALMGRRTELLTADERGLARIWTVALNLLIMLWSAIESGHLAAAPNAAGGIAAAHLPGHMLTSAAWLVQAALLLALGWRQVSALLRWSGLVLFGVTAIKFMLYDLQGADVFWRFLVAIVVGVVLLLVSYFYQRKNRALAEAREIPK